MHPKMLKAMRAKVKRPVDPNAPPRPTLLGHEKVIKGVNTNVTALQQENTMLRRRLEALESRMTAQTAYLNQLHQTVNSLITRTQNKRG